MKNTYLTLKIYPNNEVAGFEVVEQALVLQATLSFFIL